MLTEIQNPSIIYPFYNLIDQIQRDIAKCIYNISLSICADIPIYSFQRLKLVRIQQKSENQIWLYFEFIFNKNIENTIIFKFSNENLKVAIQESDKRIHIKSSNILINIEQLLTVLGQYNIEDLSERPIDVLPQCITFYPCKSSLYFFGQKIDSSSGTVKSETFDATDAVFTYGLQNGYNTQIVFNDSTLSLFSNTARGKGTFPLQSNPISDPKIYTLNGQFGDINLNVKTDANIIIKQNSDSFTVMQISFVSKKKAK